MGSTNLPWVGTRKVYAVGEGGLAILLPPAWARSKKISKDSRVLVVASDRMIIEPYNAGRIGEIHHLLDKFAGSEAGDEKDGG